MADEFGGVRPDLANAYEYQRHRRRAEGWRAACATMNWRLSRALPVGGDSCLPRCRRTVLPK